MIDSKKLICAIETSCDETAVAFVLYEYGKKTEVVSHVVSSQVKSHEPYGGVVPELAARMHAENILPVFDSAFACAQEKLNYSREDLIDKIDCIAVTQGPGLLPALAVGLETAKTLSFAWGKPLMLINHVYAHLISPTISIDDWEKDFPLISVVVSGGNTAMFFMRSPFDIELIGDTVDDAAGEAFDKVSKLLGLGYPGGPLVSVLAEKGNREAFVFPRPLRTKGFNFSFAGLKTAVLYKVRDLAKECRKGALGHGVDINALSDTQKADICASFEWCVIDVISQKIMKAVEEYGVNTVYMGGGVSANKFLRKHCTDLLEASGRKFCVAHRDYTGDNAVMIACAAGAIIQNGIKHEDSLSASPLPNLEVKSFS